MQDIPHNMYILGSQYVIAYNDLISKLMVVTDWVTGVYNQCNRQLATRRVVSLFKSSLRLYSVSSCFTCYWPPLSVMQLPLNGVILPSEGDIKEIAANNHEEVHIDITAHILKNIR